MASLMIYVRNERTTTAVVLANKYFGINDDEFDRNNTLSPPT